MINYHVFVPSATRASGACQVAESLSELLKGERPGESYSRMMRRRLAGDAAAFADDTYFLADDDGRCVSRLWHGWGRHADAIGNFGNFRTADAWRGQGIGATLLEMWHADLESRPADQRPLAFFCTSAHSMIERHYGKYGFRECFGENGGPTFLPLGNSPTSFEAFCESYYAPCGEVRFVEGDVGWRHEIDCLLKFRCMARGEPFGLPSVPSYEEAWLRVREQPGCGKLECAVNGRGHAVGWAFTPAGGVREEQIVS